MLVKILHMTFGMLVILNFVVLCYILLTPITRTHTRMSVLTKAQHFCYAMVVLFGVWQIVQLLPNNVPDWILAKIILFGVAVSASAKAIRAKDPKSMKAGLVIAAIAYMGIIWVVATKPDLGMNKSTIENKPISSSSSTTSSSGYSNTGNSDKASTTASAESTNDTTSASSSNN